MPQPLGATIDPAANIAPHAPAPANDVRYREFRVSTEDGQSVYAREYGPTVDRRPPLLCLPGLTRNCRDYQDLAARLSADRRIVCPDLRGRGQSGRAPDRRTYRAQVMLGDVVQVITAMRLHPCVILGTSFGGILAMALSVVQPRTLAGVILNDVGPETDHTALRYLKGYISECKTQPDWETAARYGRELIGKGWNKDDGVWLRLAKQSYTRQADGLLHLDYDPGVMQPLDDALEGGGPIRDMWQLFHGLAHVPALALRGAVSPVLSAETFARMAREKPDMPCVTVAGVGHVPLLDEPEAQGALDDFLARF